MWLFHVAIFMLARFIAIVVDFNKTAIVLLALVGYEMIL